MKNEIKNLPASINFKLQRYAKESGRLFQEILTLYAIECFLRRLSNSQYCESLILKGGLVFYGWGINLRRPTKDIDFQASLKNDIENMRKVIEEICSTPVEEDAIIFDTSSLQGETIMAGAEYEGVRFRFRAYLGKAYVWLQVDFSFSNIITPKEVLIEYPTLLDMPSFKLHGYNKETAIAEKLQAMVYLGGFNSRLRDYYDIFLLAKECDFEGSTFVDALTTTFKNRNTDIPSDVPTALKSEFATNNQVEWSNLLRKITYEEEEINDFGEVIKFLRNFLLPPLVAAKRTEDYNFRWTAMKGWKPK